MPRYDSRSATTAAIATGAIITVVITGVDTTITVTIITVVTAVGSGTTPATTITTPVVSIGTATTTTTRPVITIGTMTGTGIESRYESVRQLKGEDDRCRTGLTHDVFHHQDEFLKGRKISS